MIVKEGWKSLIVKINISVLHMFCHFFLFCPFLGFNSFCSLKFLMLALSSAPILHLNTSSQPLIPVTLLSQTSFSPNYAFWFISTTLTTLRSYFSISPPTHPAYWQKDILRCSEAALCISFWYSGLQQQKASLPIQTWTSDAIFAEFDYQVLNVSSDHEWIQIFHILII